MLTAKRHQTPADASKKVEDWLFSMIIAGVAFVFYVVLILHAGGKSSNPPIIYGGLVCFISVELYWVINGARHHSMSIVVLGGVGIAMALGIAHLYQQL